jgi:hypothetical protein
VLGGGIVGVADRAVPIAVINAELAPDIALADVDALLLGEVLLVGGREEP